MCNRVTTFKPQRLGWSGKEACLHKWLQAAGAAFSILFKGGAGSAVDAVIPTLLSGLEGDSKQAGQALEGLRVILGVRPGTLTSMVPRLLRPPLHSTALRALGSLAEAAGAQCSGSMNARHLHIPRQ